MSHRRGMLIGLAFVLVSASSLQAQVSGCLWPAPPQFLGDRLSAPDSTLVQLNSGLAKVCYSRPSARGRTIFGELVPYGRVWRTGADEPTMLYLSTPAAVAGVELLAGRYFLLTVPGEDEWSILLNRSDGTTPEEIVNGLVEVGRGVVDVEYLDDHVETFTIRGSGDARGAELILEWEHSRVRIPIEVLSERRFGSGHEAQRRITSRVSGSGAPRAPPS